LMKKIATMMHHSNNYKKYREALEAVEDEPCIPFHSLLLRDLTFIEDDSTFLEGLGINFEKMTLISQVFERLQDFRLQLYDVEEDPAIQLFLHNKVVKSQEELDALSRGYMEDDGLAGSDSSGLAAGGAGLDAFRKQWGVTSANLAECLKVGDLYAQFKSWLGAQNVLDQHTVECWHAMNDFIKADFGDSAYADVTLKEMAEDIYHLYLAPDATKNIGDVPDAIVAELSAALGSERPVGKGFFDEVIAGVIERLQQPWAEFKGDVFALQT